MGKTADKGPQKTNSVRSYDASTSNMKAFVEFRKTVEKEIDSAILKRLKAFREEILKSKLK